MTSNDEMFLVVLFRLKLFVDEDRVCMIDLDDWKEMEESAKEWTVGEKRVCR
jgi:hypothetical protein